MLYLLAAHGAHRTRRHRIQDCGDGAHIVLAQQQPQQPGKGLGLPFAAAQNAVQLLQGAQQDLPELAVFLGSPVVAVSIRLLRQQLQPLTQADLIQKGKQRLHHAMEIPGAAHAVPEPDQRGDAPFPGPVELRQQRSAGGSLLPAQTFGVVAEGAVPFFAPDAP